MTALNPVLSIGTQMKRSSTAPEQPAREAAKAADYLARVRIPDPEQRLRQYPHQFSGGMRQRICIAMALLAEPDLMIADEPTTALDATLEAEVIALLKQLQRETGCAVLFISHHLGAVAQFCDDVAIMYAGEVVERGSVRQIFHDPRHPYTRELLNAIPAASPSLANAADHPGRVARPRREPQGCIFRPRCPERFERCVERPPPCEVASGHLSACHKAHALAPLGRLEEA